MCQLENARIKCSNESCQKLFHEKCAHLNGYYNKVGSSNTRIEFFCYNCYIISNKNKP